MSTIITPTVGRVVWFFEGGNVRPLAGLIAYVHSDRVINVGYFDANGVAKSCTSVPLAQHEGEIPAQGPYAIWMPYQKAQAAKAEAQAQVVGSGS